MERLIEQAEEIIKDPSISDFVPAAKKSKETELENALVQPIGLLLCKGKDKLVAEYAIKDINKPMGISGYKLSNKISDDLQENLPTIEDIESRINN